MGFTPTVYRWDDAGAPSIGTRKPSEIINILKKQYCFDKKFIFNY